MPRPATARASCHAVHQSRTGDLRSGCPNAGRPGGRTRERLPDGHTDQDQQSVHRCGIRRARAGRCGPRPHHLRRGHPGRAGRPPPRLAARAVGTQPRRRLHRTHLARTVSQCGGHAGPARVVPARSRADPAQRRVARRPARLEHRRRARPRCRRGGGPDRALRRPIARPRPRAPDSRGVQRRRRRSARFARTGGRHRGHDAVAGALVRAAVGGEARRGGRRGRRPRAGLHSRHLWRR